MTSPSQGKVHRPQDLQNLTHRTHWRLRNLLQQHCEMCTLREQNSQAPVWDWKARLLLLPHRGCIRLFAVFCCSCCCCCFAFSGDHSLEIRRVGNSERQADHATGGTFRKREEVMNTKICPQEWDILASGCAIQMLQEEQSRGAGKVGESQ